MYLLLTCLFRQKCFFYIFHNISVDNMFVVWLFVCHHRTKHQCQCVTVETLQVSQNLVVSISTDVNTGSILNAVTRFIKLLFHHLNVFIHVSHSLTACLLNIWMLSRSLNIQSIKEISVSLDIDDPAASVESIHAAVTECEYYWKYCSNSSVRVISLVSCYFNILALFWCFSWLYSDMLVLWEPRIFVMMRFMF